VKDNFFKLKFKDKATERDFSKFYNLETRFFIRSGLINASLVWITGIVLFYVLYNDKFLALTLPILLFILPLKLFIIFTTYSDRFLNHQQWMTAVANSSAGLFVLYITHLIVLNNTITISFLMILVIFCFLIFRLRIIFGLIATLSYVATFQVILLTSELYSTNDAILLSFIIWVTEGVVVVVALIIEYSMRTIFQKNRIIEENRKKLLLEKEISERLLLNILPIPIARRLRNNEENIADNFECVTVLFADIVGFTDLSNKVAPQELVKILNNVFSKFDDLVDKYGLEKIKTIGDAYMVAAGIPENREDHAEAIAEFAIDMVSEVSTSTSQSEYPLKIRVGINSGPVIAGVIGKKKFIYDLWGDSVNLAARMESQGMAGEIQVTRANYELIKDKYVFESRGMIDIKGKGQVETFLLKGRKYETN
jgi:class 3 adenylate cyclase